MHHLGFWSWIITDYTFMRLLIRNIQAFDPMQWSLQKIKLTPGIWVVYFLPTQKLHVPLLSRSSMVLQILSPRMVASSVLVLWPHWPCWTFWCFFNTLPFPKSHRIRLSTFSSAETINKVNKVNGQLFFFFLNKMLFEVHPLNCAIF